MGKFKSFILDESNLLGLLNFEVHYDGKILGKLLAKNKESALGKAKLKYFGKDGFSGNEKVEVKLIKEDLNESSEYLKQFFKKEDSDRETKMFRSDSKWAKITQFNHETKIRVALGRKGEIKASKIQSGPDIDWAIIVVEHWFKDV